MIIKYKFCLMLPKNIVVLYIIMLCMNKDIILFHLMV